VKIEVDNGVVLQGQENPSQFCPLECCNAVTKLILLLVFNLDKKVFSVSNILELCNFIQFSVC